MEETTAWPAHEIKYRDPTLVAVLNLVTLGVYWFYLIYVWSKDLNWLLRREKYPAGLMLLLSIVTCGLAGIVLECLIAADLSGEAVARSDAAPNRNLLAWVIALNISALVAAIVLPIIGIVVSMPLGIAATVLVQIELNKLAELERTG